MLELRRNELIPKNRQPTTSKPGQNWLIPTMQKHLWYPISRKELRNSSPSSPLAQADLRCSYIKMMQESCTAIFGTPIPIPSPELQAAIVTAAHKHNLITLAHALTQSETILALEAGVDGLAHCFCDQVPSQELVEAYKKNNSFLIPTLALITSMTGDEIESSKEHEGHELAGRLLDDDSKSCFCRKSLLASEGCKVEFAYQTIRLLKESGLDIVA